MENMEKDYLMSSIDEYFNLLDAENQKRSQMVAKSLTKYLKNSMKWFKRIDTFSSEKEYIQIKRFMLHSHIIKFKDYETTCT